MSITLTLPTIPNPGFPSKMYESTFPHVDGAMALSQGDRRPPYLVTAKEYETARSDVE